MTNTTPRVLGPDDVAGLLRLKEAASWNQTEADCRRMLALAPGGCFGIDCDGVLAASATAVCYGTDLAWIGMVLTDPEFRGRGFARQLMEHAIEYAAEQGVRWAKLDATDMGAPLYRRLGFETECLIGRFCRKPAPAAAHTPPQIGPPDDALDRQAFGADRTALLEALAAERACRIASGAHAFGRDGSRAPYFGPCVSTSAEAVRPLVEDFLAEYPDRPTFWDILSDNHDAVELAKSYGFEPVRELQRMSRPLVPTPAPLKTDTAITFAIAGFEFG